MNIIQILKNLYTNKKCDWINDINDTDIQPFVIQRWLAMNDQIRVQTRWLDKYVYPLPPKMYLSLAWSIIPKSEKPPFVKYIKKVEEDEEFDFILNLVRRHFKMSDNDFNSTKDRIINAIKSDMVDWFRFYGIPKKYWKKYYLNFNQIKESTKEDNKQRGLEAFGM